jgi:ribose transport system ATP-binding protein
MERKEKYPRVPAERREKVLEVRNLCAGAMVRNVSFDIYAGEIVGIAGLMGAGRTETTRAVFGVDSKDSGEVILKGEPLRIRGPADAIKAGLVLVPEDRKKDGLCLKLSIKENISLPNLDILSGPMSIINRKKEKAMAEKSVRDLRIRTDSVEKDAKSLSGGNQQKVVGGKWLARDSKVILFDEPTRGVDVGAKVDIYNLMNQLKQQGIGVLFVSSELPEILGFSDRIIVMCDGRVTGELSREEATQDKIMEYATMFESKIG